MGEREEFSKNAAERADRARKHADRAYKVSVRAVESVAKLTLRRKKLRETRATNDEAQQVGAAEYTYTGHHQYHGTVLIKVANGRITHWREYQHIDPRPWENFVGTSRFA